MCGVVWFRPASQPAGASPEIFGRYGEIASSPVVYNLLSFHPIVPGGVYIP